MSHYNDVYNVFLFLIIMHVLCGKSVGRFELFVYRAYRNYSVSKHVSHVTRRNNMRSS